MSKASRNQFKTQKKKKKKKIITTVSSTTRKLSLSFPYLVPKKLSYSWATHQKTRYSSQPDSNPKTHNQVSKSLATTKTERREIRVLQFCHTTTNKQPRLDLVESFHDNCYTCHHHHLLEPLLRLVLTITSVPRHHDFNFA